MAILKLFLGRCHSNRDAVALQRDGQVDCVYVGADYGHEVRLRRCDVDLAGRSTAGDSDVVGMAVEEGCPNAYRVSDNRNRSRYQVGGEIDH